MNNQRKPRIAFVLPGQARRNRIDGVAKGECPREFFYGGLALSEKNYEVKWLDFRQPAETLFGKIQEYFERKINGLTQFGLSRTQVRRIARQTNDCDLVISFTDSFSLSMGHYRHLMRKNLTVVGGYHALTDMHQKARPVFRPLFRHIIRKSLLRLNQAMTSGKADQQAAIDYYNLPNSVLHHYDFAVDQDFWKPASDRPKSSTVEGFVAIGSDLQRDYDVLARATLPAMTRVVTRLNIPGASSNPKLKVTNGSLAASPLDDQDIRDLYRQAIAVIVPVHDVWQPSGCSVTLQAMSCGTPVILTDYKGLFDRDLLVDKENCLLVPPNDSAAMQQAMQYLIDYPQERSRIAAAALETAQAHFGLERLNRYVNALVEHYVSGSN